MRWLMSLGEHTRPDAPAYAEDPAPDQARALALVDDFAHLFTVLRAWRQEYGEELTAWAVQVEADDVENLPADVTEQWAREGAPVRIDTLRGGYVKVSDYREVAMRPGVSTRTVAGVPLWTARP
ncbi:MULTISPECIES: hypothetical protein [unclassified Streptomyces]|uniref:hypothetical protein n=1 Tax=unclassified Streptomyces TaxID=2593676 RepID=UPI00136FF7D8|nr:hypothetical protein [Streptomyces sp. SID5789]MZE73878.1 hypothetical protein [Streptomyces sp. SID5789]